MTTLDYNIDWSKYFVLDCNSSSGLRWAVSRGTKAKGSIAGTINGQPSGYRYWDVSVNGVKYQVHRIIYQMVSGYIDPQLVVNHIDNDALNNAISNLEVCSVAENSRRGKCHTKVGLYRNNKSGLNAIREAPFGDYLYAQVQWNDLESKRHSKYFSYKKLGKEKAWECAIQFQKQLIEELNKAGAGYTKTE